MYHALLTNRYLTSRVIPLIAVAAVALCVALVIIVVSVMTGFLDMVRASGRTLMGDVVVSYPISGIPHYERLIERIMQLPEAAAATPVVDGLGLLKMPYPDGPEKQTEMVQFWGIEPESFAAVTGYEKTLHWREIAEDHPEDLPRELWHRLLADVLMVHWKDVLTGLSEEQRFDLLKRAFVLDSPAPADVPDDETIRNRLPTMTDDYWERVFYAVRTEADLLRAVLTPEQWQGLLAHDARLTQRDGVLREGLTLEHKGDNRTAVLGMHISELNRRTQQGTYMPAGMGRWWMPRYQVTLTTLPIREGVDGADAAENRILQVVNEFVSGVFLIDDKRIMLPLVVAQSMLHLDEMKRVDEEFREIGVDPKRATMVLVRAKDGVTPERLRDAVIVAYEQFREQAIRDDSGSGGVQPPVYGMGLSIHTWAQQQAQFIGPVEKEREIMRTLFSLVYIVCAGLVLAIFWAIVYEKTRDIGILRSVGASRLGISWIFLRYGLVVGIFGAIFGLGLAYLIVYNINLIHEALGDPPIALAVIVLALALVALVATIVRGMSGNLLPIVLGGLVTILFLILGGAILWLRFVIGGVVVWDPSIYYFTKIPNQVDVNSAYITMIGAVVFSLIGAFIPAAKAADTDPVKALRYE